MCSFLGMAVHVCIYAAGVQIDIGSICGVAIKGVIVDNIYSETR